MVYLRFQISKDHMGNYISIPYLKISPQKLTWYNILDKPKNYTKIQFQKKDFNQISSSTNKRLKEIIENFLFSCKTIKYFNIDSKKYCTMKCALITLTLPEIQIKPDIFYKKILNNFLTVLRNRFKIHKYVWRAETQQNGNIHFHILINKYIYWKKIRDIWNRILNYNGCMSNFFEKFKHLNPNSTDIHSLKRIRNISAYISKYMTKGNINISVSREIKNVTGIYDIATHQRIIEGKKYGCSLFLTKMKSLVIMLSDKYKEISSILYFHFKNKIKCYDFADVLYISAWNWRNFAPELWNIFTDNFKKIYFENIPLLYLK